MTLVHKADLEITIYFMIILCSFHVGSGCQTPSTYQTALKMSAELFQYGTDIGFNFSLLDIGGGFPGSKNSTDLFIQVTFAISQSLQTLFSTSSYPGLRVIAEPGMCNHAHQC